MNKKLIGALVALGLCFLVCWFSFETKNYIISTSENVSTEDISEIFADSCVMKNFSYDPFPKRPQEYHAAIHDCSLGSPFPVISTEQYLQVQKSVGGFSSAHEFDQNFKDRKILRTSKIYETCNRKDLNEISMRHLNRSKTLNERTIIDRIRSLNPQELKDIRPVFHSHNPNLNSLICIPPKTGTTSWQLAMLALESNKKIQDMMQLDPEWETNLYGVLTRYFNMLPKSEILTDYELNGLNSKGIRWLKDQQNFETLDPKRWQYLGDNFTDLIHKIYYPERYPGVDLYNMDNVNRGTKWKSVWLRTTNLVKTIDILAQHLFVTGKSQKLINVRHPFCRLLSAWNDKFNYLTRAHPKVKSGQYSEVKIQKHNQKARNYSLKFKFIRKFETAKTLKTKPGSATFSFEAYLQYIAHGSQGSPDIHWIPMYELCSPCLINYDYVSKLETINSDSDYWIDSVLNARKIIENFPQANNVKKSLTTADEVVVNAFKNIPQDLIQKLYEIYELDFLLFDYKIDSFLT